jgi:phosphotransferase system  glucose/maltose/N-acetylglucosamine-specific IIC component
MLRGLIGWILTIGGIILGVSGAIQVLIGTVIAIRGQEVTAHLGVAAGGAVILGLGALIAWSGRRLRRPRGRIGSR